MFDVFRGMARAPALATSVALATLVVSSSWLLAQEPAGGAPGFEIASVKVNTSGPPGPNNRGPSGTRTQPNGRFVATNMTVRQLIFTAYPIARYQLIGGPEWLDTERYDINAKAPGDATRREMNLMLRSLLQERFTLRMRTETREGTTFVLVRVNPDKLGPQLWPTTPECAARLEERERTGGAMMSAFPNPGERPACGAASVRLGGGGARTTASGGVPVQSLVSLVTGEVDGPVQNQTGLTGPFDYTLAYLSKRARNLPPGVSPPPDSPDDVSPPTLRVALEEQLGLRLESRPGPITVTIIDGIEHPTPD